MNAQPALDAPMRPCHHRGRALSALQLMLRDREPADPIPTSSLADARAKAKALVRQVFQGTDPAAEKAAERLAETFAQLAAEYLERHTKPRKRTWREDERILRRELLPHWGRMKAKGVTRRDLRLLIDRVVERDVPTYANRSIRPGPQGLQLRAAA